MYLSTRYEGSGKLFFYRNYRTKFKVRIKQYGIFQSIIYFFNAALESSWLCRRIGSGVRKAVLVYLNY